MESTNLLSDLHDIMTDNEIEPSVAERIIKELSTLWAGISVYIPKGRTAMSDQLRMDICRDYKEGASVKQLVKKYKVTGAWIYQVVKEGKATSKTSKHSLSV